MGRGFRVNAECILMPAYSSSAESNDGNVITQLLQWSTGKACSTCIHLTKAYTVQLIFSFNVGDVSVFFICRV